jgi:hypothetical protein
VFPRGMPAKPISSAFVPSGTGAPSAARWRYANHGSIGDSWPGAPYAVSACGAFDFASCVATNSRSKPIRENQLDKAGNPIGIKSLFADFVPSVLLPGMVAPLPLGCPRLPVQHLRQFIFFSRVGRPSCTLLRILFCEVPRPTYNGLSHEEHYPSDRH